MTPTELLALPDGCDWPTVEVTTSVGAPPPFTGIERRRAAFALLDGAWAIVDRDAGTAVRGAPAPADPTGLVHPFLAAVAAVHAAWNARLALHSGAFLAGGGAWLLVGASGSGKSSTLAALAAAGTVVLADDLAVVAGGDVLAGPRGVDLRPGVAAELGVAAHAVRRGLRERVQLGAAPLAAPLRGVVHLAWSADDTSPALEPLAPAERLARLAREDLWAVPAPGPDRLLELVALPAFVLHRPRDLAALAAVVTLLRGLR